MSDDKKIHINIEGYGKITVDRPFEIEMEVAANFAAAVVAQVATLMAPSTQAKRFHPVTGMGGYS